MSKLVRYRGRSLLLGTIVLFGCGGRYQEQDNPDSAVAEPRAGGPCAARGARACVGVAQRGTLECDGSQWQSAGECKADEVCDVRPGPTRGTCEAPVCAAGETRCEGATLSSCDVDRLGWARSECTSEEHCRQAVGTRCARCLAWQARCEGAVLLKCGLDRQELSPTTTCESAGLCDALNATCKPPACVAGARRCEGNVLQRCNVDLTRFETESSCGDGLCDAVLGRCRECLAGERDCVGAAPRRCDDMGVWQTEVPCSGSTPVCNAGVCVAGSCTPGAWRCAGDDLQKCDASATGFSSVMTCMSGLCDAIAGECFSAREN